MHSEGELGVLTDRVCSLFLSLSSLYVHVHVCAQMPEVSVECLSQLLSAFLFITAVYYF